MIQETNVPRPLLMSQQEAAPEILNDLICLCDNACTKDCTCENHDQPCTAACSCEARFPA